MTGGATISTQCCIVGGGPAGMMLGYLLARAGVGVVVLEKHADFLRDFRGDTVHPSTTQIMDELGLLDAFLQRPHQELTKLSGSIDGTEITIADFSHMPTRCTFLTLMPQWDFLNFLAQEATTFPAFELRMQAEVVDVLRENGAVAGVTARTPDGALDVRAPLVVACDGRHSTLRDRVGFAPVEFGAPMDVLWMRLSRKEGDERQTFGNIRHGRILVMLDRGVYWQCAFVIAKGSLERLQASGLDALREQIVATVPQLADRVQELRDWNDVKLLTVQVDRLREWYAPGILCIGDAAHAMSPIGGVGINLAIQDAVAAANILAESLARGSAPSELLRAVQRRRTFPTEATQRMQLIIQNNLLAAVLQRDRHPRLAPVIWLVSRIPLLRRILARLVGIGFRPEHPSGAIVQPDSATTRSRA